MRQILAPPINWNRLFPKRTRPPPQQLVPIIIPLSLRRRFRLGMEINAFKFCSGLRVLGYFMIVLVAAIIGVSYYAVIVVVWGPQLLRGGARSALALLVVVPFHSLLAMLIWSYLRVVIQDPGSVPENWRARLSEESLEASDATVSADSISGEGSDRRVGYCNRCRNGKPPRCHHCSVYTEAVFIHVFSGQRCVLKMDHHCVWVVNCIGAGNYKFFLLFLLYTFLETTLATFALLPSFIKFFDHSKNFSSSPADLAATFMAFVLNLAFAASLLFFLVMHASLLMSNTTSIEVHEKKGVVRWKYDLGRKKNFEQVFGTKRALWLLPLFSGDDLNNIGALKGIDFPTRSDVET
ncbi:Probable protein S-acyltransferase 12 [Linum grandiflorum]